MSRFWLHRFLPKEDSAGARTLQKRPADIAIYFCMLRAAQQRSISAGRSKWEAEQCLNDYWILSLYTNLIFHNNNNFGDNDFAPF